MSPVNAAGPPYWPHRLGKKPARHGGIIFNLWNYFSLADIPKPPEHFRHATPPKWIDYNNSTYGDCVWSGAANETALWEHEGGQPIPEFTTENVLSDYAACAGFDRNKPETDQGTDMGDAAAYRRKTGILDAHGNRHKIDAYAHVKLKSWVAFKAALWFLGGIGLGFRFPGYAMNLFNAGKAWDVEPGEVQGGHYVPAFGVKPNGNIICVSWGTEVEMTQRFYLEYADEVVGYIDLDRINRITKLTPENFAEERLKQDLACVAAGQVYALNNQYTDWA